MQARAATSYPATPEPSFVVVGPRAEARARARLQRFQEAIQSVLDTPLDATRVFEWTRHRSILD